MGYRSEVAIGVAFENEADLKEVMAVYCMHPMVQKHDVAKEWKLASDNTVMYFHNESVKWYPEYEDVKAYEHIKKVCEDFAAKRDMPYALMFTRIGEENGDIEEGEASHNDPHWGLMEQLQDLIMVSHPYIDITARS